MAVEALIKSRPCVARIRPSRTLEISLATEIIGAVEAAARRIGLAARLALIMALGARSPALVAVTETIRKVIPRLRPRRQLSQAALVCA